MFQITPGWAGFIKGILAVLVLAAASYLGDVAHLTGVLNPVMATIVAGIFSGIESSLKSSSDGTKALFGAVAIKK